jgi:hypothetical protein
MWEVRQLLNLIRRLLRPLNRFPTAVIQVRRYAALVSRLDPQRSVLRTPSVTVCRPSDATLRNAAVCLYVCTALEGIVRPHARRAIANWTEGGFSVFALVVVDSLDSPLDLEGLGTCAGVMVRENAGVDFGAWAAALRRCPALLNSGLLVIANDSVIGPFSGYAMKLRRQVEETGADVVGIVESHEIRRHFQSWCVFFKPRALRSPAFHRFWQGVTNLDRQAAIGRFETTLVARMEGSGLVCRALYGPDPNRPSRTDNLAMSEPARLIQDGCCFIKLKLFRGNPDQVPERELQGLASILWHELDEIDVK